MIRRSTSLLAAAGSLALAIGIALRLSAYGNFAHAGSGFFLGVSIALLILGVAQPSRRISR